VQPVERVAEFGDFVHGPLLWDRPAACRSDDRPPACPTRNHIA
jgi:hypothetical protein